MTHSFGLFVVLLAFVFLLFSSSSQVIDVPSSTMIKSSYSVSSFDFFSVKLDFIPVRGSPDVSFSNLDGSYTLDGSLEKPFTAFVAKDQDWELVLFSEDSSSFRVRFLHYSLFIPGLFLFIIGLFSILVEGFLRSNK